MRNLSRPVFAASEVFDAAASRFTDSEFRRRLAVERASMLASARAYEQAANTSSLHLIPQASDVGCLSNSELVSLYSYGLLRRKSVAREFYEKIKLSAKNVCPSCNHRAVAQLDHYLAKSKFGAFVVDPNNLVPICHQCNFDKLSRSAETFADLPLHPYFDDIGRTFWLKCELIESPNPIGRFFVDKSILSGELGQKVENHMMSLSLDVLYTVESAVEINRLSAFIRRMRTIGEVTSSQILRSKAEAAEETEPNSWRHALYRACASEVWFLRHLDQ